jgi:hypothetical protein
MKKKYLYFTTIVLLTNMLQAFSVCATKESQLLKKLKLDLPPLVIPKNNVFDKNINCSSPPPAPITKYPADNLFDEYKVFVSSKKNDEEL